jgi:hypothetical protein
MLLKAEAPGTTGRYVSTALNELVVIDRDYRIIDANNIEIYGMIGELL